MKKSKKLGAAIAAFALITMTIPAAAQTNPPLSIFRAWGLSFPTETNAFYLIETSTNLSNWSAVGDLVTGTGTNATVYYNDQPDSNRFFRAVGLGTLTNGLVAFYSLNGNGLDASGYTNHGTFGGGTSATTNRFGASNAAMAFNGVDATFTAPNAPQLQMTGAVSVSVWFQFQTGGVNPAPRLVEKAEQFTLVTVGTGSSRPVAFGLVKGGGYQDLTTAQSFPQNVWHHMVATYDGSAMRIYVNGALKASVPGTGALGISTYDLAFAYDIKNSFDRLKGSIDEVRIYDRALSESEISGLYLLKQ